GAVLVAGAEQTIGQQVAGIRVRQLPAVRADTVARISHYGPHGQEGQTKGAQRDRRTRGRNGRRWTAGRWRRLRSDRAPRAKHPPGYRRSAGSGSSGTSAGEVVRLSGFGHTRASGSE